jgi:hypothetical protein
MKYFLRETATAGIYPSLLGIALTDFNFFRTMLGTSKRLGTVSKWVRATRAEQGGAGNGSDLLSLLGLSPSWSKFMRVDTRVEKANRGDSKYKLTDEEIQAQIGYARLTFST